jgi:protein associated with RNAse G/E
LNKRSTWKPGETATLRGVGHKVYWAYPTIVVQDTAHLIVLYMPAGVIGRNTDHRVTPQEFFSPEKINIVDHQWQRTDVLILIVPGEPFSIYLMREAGTKNQDCWYINLQEPIRRTTIGFDTMDHVLDVVVNPEMTEWKWKDDDEFAEAERIGFYTPQIARQIWSDGEKAIKSLTSERRAFYEEWKDWQAKPEWKIPELTPFWEINEPVSGSLRENK